MNPGAVFVALAGLSLTIAVPGLAQPRPGDYVLGYRGSNSSRWDLAYLDRSTGKLTSLTWSNEKTAIVTMARDNRDLRSVSYQYPGYLLNTTPAGVRSTVLKLPGHTILDMAVAMELDQDGNYLIAQLPLHVFLAIGSALQTITTTSLADIVRGVTIDQDTGDYILATTSSTMTIGNLLRINRFDRRRTTLASGSVNVLGWEVHFEPRTGGFVVHCSNGLCRVDRSGRPTSVVSTQNIRAFSIDPETGHLHCLVGYSLVTEYSPQGKAIRTFNSGGNWDCIELYGSREICGRGTAHPGSTYTLDLSFPAAGAGKTYVAALSLSGLRPGISLADGRRINIVPDALFFQTLKGDIPGVTQGISGRLGAGGAATVILTLPRGIPPGVRIRATAVALDGASPLGLDTANTWSFSVLP